jgi:SNF2 family DNA or RNA helicase
MVLHGTEHFVKGPSGEPAKAEWVIAELGRDRGVQIRQRNPGIRFSRRALEPAAKVSGRFPADLSIDVGVISGDQFAPSAVGVDQVIVGEFWHPIQSRPLEEMISHIGGSGSFPRSMSPKEFLQVESQPKSWSLVVELETVDAVSWARDLEQQAPLRHLRAELYPYQSDGIGVLRHLASQELGCLLADQMGLGKTLQVIGMLADQPKGSVSLIIAPSALLVNWITEIGKFCPDLSAHVHAGPMRFGVPKPFRAYDVVVTTYETAVNDIGILEEVPWRAVVLDEAQQIRNPDAVRSGLVKRLPRHISVAVTGTPVENRLRDLWSISEYVLPSLLGSRTEFEKQFPDEETAARVLGEIVRPLTIRRRVAEVAKDLPELVETHVPMPMDARLKNLHEDLGTSGKGRLAIDTPLRMLCAHADELISDAEFLSTAKVSRLLAMLEEIAENGEKALVFAPFQQTLDRLSRVARISGLHSRFNAVVDGRMPSADRQRTVDKFNGFEGGGVLFLNPRAAGVGLNITGANHVVHFSPEYNPQVTNQATARAYRRKQSKTVFAHHFFYVNSIEDTARRIADDKEALAVALDRGIREGGDHEG